MFNERYCSENPRYWTLEDVRKIMSTTEADASKDKAGPISAPDLLQWLLDTLQAEAFELHFNYQHLHRICWRLLCRLKTSCEPSLLHAYGPGYIENDNQLPLVVGYVLMVVTGTRKLEGLIRARKEDVGVTSALMVQAAKVIASFVKDQGSELCQFMEREYGFDVDV